MTKSKAHLPKNLPFPAAGRFLTAAPRYSKNAEVKSRDAIIF